MNQIGNGEGAVGLGVLHCAKPKMNQIGGKVKKSVTLILT